ncbi:Phosphoglycerol transferase MdoB [Paenibacillus sp. UNCCL117]|uniref:LTA synthase family protein n=1 Tax=unclassified Paenibacillus TaxID=185978 RepID=UPI0008872A39|nr:MULTISPECIES: LTA synthase family protein [unclassified Paenibacillus]SDD77665.1 Phosphoglycerol transferase MdoB [Paenibacillus sp. cl123]SFW52787.1 Phosphoglycerol transferase MdoB [Paenibacillus sp. UNCCL117]
MRTTSRKGRSRRGKPVYTRAVHTIALCTAILVLPLLLAAGAELLHRGSLSETWTWIFSHPQLFALNGLLAMLVFLLLYAICGAYSGAAALSAALLALVALVSYFKRKLIGEPFFPWDIFLNKESMNILPLVTSREAVIRLCLAGLAAVLLFLFGTKLPRSRMRVPVRVAVGLLCVVALYGFGVRAAWSETLVYKAGAGEIVWNQSENYAENGLAVAFTMNVKNTIVKRPPGYTETAMRGLAESLNEMFGYRQAKAVVASAGGGESVKQPNVIFIMNEAFWDPTLLPGVTFDQDPLPTVRRLQKESTGGYMLSPQFGGGTSNVEFEVLSGQSMSFLPAGSVPYQQYISKPLPSLASYFKEKGYTSTAIHSYEGWFWNRESVYRHMGFDQFISKSGFEAPEYRGAFISDDEVSRRIINEVESSEAPSFIYAVTMQNHGPYDDRRYGDQEITVKGMQTDTARDTLATYAQGVRDADKSLQMLIDHFEQSAEPTIIVFYGDHLPMLGYDYDVYAQAGFISTNRSEQWSLEELKKMQSVPLVTWSNFYMPKETVPVISSSFLGAYVLDRIGMELPPAWAYQLELSKKAPGILRNLVVAADGQLYNELPPSIKDDAEVYRELQYDEMFGQRYIAQYFNDLLPEAPSGIAAEAETEADSDQEPAQPVR